MSLEVYEQARKIGLRCVKTRAAQGLDPYLPALEDDKLKILKTQELPVTAIPLDCVTGTRTRGRTNSFAADFMPLLEPASEFAGKCMKHSWRKASGSRSCASNTSDISMSRKETSGSRS